ncbi:hypothetical protein M0Q39_05975 [Patescibacteria group bacterium]|nr:hypothetical protein [Patescibacteria group bacterium]
MPILIVYGIPTETDKGTLEIFSELMRNRAADIEELGITKEQVSIFFPSDLMAQGLGEEIIIFVEGLVFENPDGASKINKKIVTNLVDEAHQSFPKTRVIECIVRPLNAKQSFCSAKLQQDGTFWGDCG